jgi:hypothetical protein
MPLVKLDRKNRSAFSARLAQNVLIIFAISFITGCSILQVSRPIGGYQAASYPDLDNEIPALPLAQPSLGSDRNQAASPPPGSTYQDVTFENISLEHGLSQSVINAILQDSRGFLWFATQDGLNRYDGYEFRIFENDPENPNSLSHNWVTAIVEDHTGALWVGTNGGGLNRFDRDLEQFVRYPFDSNNPNSLGDGIVQTIIEDSEGTLWIGTFGGGLSRFDWETTTFTHYMREPEDPVSISDNNVLTILETRSGVLYVGTGSGHFLRFDRQREEFEVLLEVPGPDEDCRPLSI